MSEVHLCHACSCHEILRMETPGQDLQSQSGGNPYVPMPDVTAQVPHLSIHLSTIFIRDTLIVSIILIRAEDEPDRHVGESQPPRRFASRLMSGCWFGSGTGSATTPRCRGRTARSGASSRSWTRSRVRWPFLAAVLAEIYPCNVCSCQEILRRSGLAQPRPRR
eukprot:COSAG01_NODE_17567_length_1140_cov_0.471662_2_plen_164_part_00